MIGKSVLHYKISEKLGQGGMGIVFKALDTKLQREVALKFLPQMAASGEGDKERFRKEAQAVAALNHSCISHIYAIEETQDEVFLVMEYIDGRELKELTTAKELIPRQDAIDYALQTAEGLQAAHKKGIIHRDIKSSNIMVTQDNKIKVMDFGLAKIQGTSQLTIQGTTLGTIAYMSPEQSSAKSVDHRTDIWAFGVLLYELMCNDYPFKADYDQAILYAVMNEDPINILDVNPDTPQAVVDIIYKCLDKDPQQRFQSMDEIIKLLTDIKYATEKPSPVENNDRQLSEEKKRPASFSALTIVSLSLALIITAYYLFFTEDAQPPVNISNDHISDNTTTENDSEPSDLINNLRGLTRTADFLKQLDIYKKEMQIAVGNRDDFPSKEGCYVFVADKDEVKAVFVFKNNGFRNLVTGKKVSSLQDTYGGHTAIWLRDYSQ